MSNLPIKSSANALIVAQLDGGTVAKVKVTRAVGEGIKALQVAFPVMSQTPDDRALAMKLYAEAVEGFHPAVQEFALRWLRLHNPRNTPTFTQPPTAQDVHECCGHVLATWKNRIVAHFMGHDSPRGPEFLPWGEEPHSSYFNSKRNPLPWGSEPFSAYCDTPDDLVFSIMHEWLARPFMDVDELVTMPQDQYDRLRSQFWTDGHKTRIDKLRKERAERLEAERKHEEYLDSLGNDLRAARADIMALHNRKRWLAEETNEEFEMPDEAEIIEQAKSLIILSDEERKAKEALKAKRDAEHAEACRLRAAARAADPQGYEAAIATNRSEPVAEFYDKHGAGGFFGVDDYQARRRLIRPASIALGRPAEAMR